MKCTVLVNSLNLRKAVIHPDPGMQDFFPQNSSGLINIHEVTVCCNLVQAVSVNNHLKLRDQYYLVYA